MFIKISELSFLFLRQFTVSKCGIFIRVQLGITNTATRLSGGTRYRGWLRHCPTTRKVAVLIPEGVTGIYH
jgi:hypothetical protein